jgi:Zn-dependent M28 family amino/carboxypeptidase
MATLTAGSTTFDTGSFTYSGAGTVTGKIVAVDVNIPPLPAPGSTSGCEADDFDEAAFTGTNDIALIQRGTCTFGVKALNAQEAGAEAVIIFNEGQAGRTDLLVGTLGAPEVTIPVVGASYADALSLLAAGTASVSASTISEVRTTYNVTAQTAGGNADNVVMLGAHLDSVIAGPGINDNGSGSAGILEVALDMAKVQPTNAVRFAWWGAEELGLLGSEHYVATLPQAELDKIALYLNFDMIASPNYVRFVYDGDDSDSTGAPTDAPAGPDGSDDIEDVFTDYFSAMGLASEATDFSGRSDYGPFIAQGVEIPSGGLFTGAEELKTEAQEAAYGGVAGAAYDPCYHERCDDLDNYELLTAEQKAVYDELNAEYRMIGNVNMDAFEENIDAIAHSVITFAYSTELVNGVVGDNGKGKTKIKRAPGGGVSGGAGDPSGGGLHDDHDHELPAA